MAVLSSIIVILIATAVGLLIHGQYVWDAALLGGVGMLLLAGILLRKSRLPSKLTFDLKSLLLRDWLMWARMGALGLSFLVALAARGKPSTGDFTGLFVWWMFGVALFGVSEGVRLLSLGLNKRLHTGEPSVHGEGSRFTGETPKCQYQQDVGAPSSTRNLTFLRKRVDGLYALRDAISRVRGYRGIQEYMDLNRMEWFGLVGLLVFAFLARAVMVGRIPANLGGDEGTQLVEAINMVAQGMRNPFGTGWYSVPTLSFLVPGLWMKVFGASVVSGRMLSVCAGTLTVLTTWLMARSMGGKRAAWVAATVVAVSAYHIHFSRLASNQIADPLVGTLVFWLVWEAVFCTEDTSRRQALWAYAGMVSGLGWYSYFGARWVSVLVAVFSLWRTLVDQKYLKRHWWGMVRFLSGWLVIVLPLLGWYTRYPSPLSERYNAVSIFASGWLAKEVVITGKSAVALVLEQLWLAFSAWHVTPDRAFWYRPEQPLADVITGTLMLVGAMATLWTWRKPERLMTLLWFVPTTVMAWAFTLSNPSSQRGLLLVPAVGLLVAWGCESLFEGFTRWRKWLSYAVAGLMAVSAVLNLMFYFGVYTPRRTYGNPTAEIGTELARWMLENPQPVCSHLEWGICEGQVVFMGPPWMYWGFGALAFTLRDFEGFDVPRGAIPPDVVRPARFVFVYERVGQLAGVQVSYPGGVVHEVRADDGRVLAVVYDW